MVTAIPPRLPSVLGLTFATLASAFAQSGLAAPTNVILILPDQWRAQAAGYAGDPNVETPHLDQLANQSVDCVHAVAAMPVCCPTRASLLTGQRPLTHGVFMNDVPLKTNATTLAEALRAAGYDTGYVGKWHLNGGNRSAVIPPDRRFGFVYWKAAECTHDYNHSSYRTDDGRTRQWQGYDAIAQTNDAIQFIRQHASAKKPFFLVLAWGPPHSPYGTAPAQYRARYAPERIQLRANVPPHTEASARRMLVDYYAHCTALDDCVGRLWAALEESAIEANTLLIFTSDHGDMLGSQASRNKQQPYDESLRVPLLVHWPAGLGRQPARRDAVISSEDLMPTILGLCGASIPTTVEGLDYSQYLRGGRDPSDGAVLISCAVPFGQWSRKDGGREYRGLRTVQFTYVRDLSGPWLLFDDEKDPFQQTNLVGRADYAAVQSTLDKLLRAKLGADHDRFLPGAEYVKRWGYHLDRNGTVPYAN